MAILEGFQNEALPPCDWKMVAMACLLGGDYLLWKSEWYDLSEQQARRNAAHDIPISVEMLTGEGQYLDLV